MASKSNTAPVATPTATRKRKPANPAPVAPVGLVIDAETPDVHTFDVLKTAIFGDGSTFAPNAWVDLPRLVEESMAAISPWYQAYQSEISQSEALGKLGMEIRERIVRADGQSDWAGGTFAYRELYGKRFDHACTAAGMDLTTKKGKTARNKLNGKVREYRSFNKVVPLTIAMDLVKKDPELAKTIHKVGAVEKTFEELVATAATGVAVTIPAPLQSKIREVYRTQTDLEGKRYAGFADTDVPKTLGDTRKRVGTTNKAAPNTPGTGWAQARSDLAKTTIGTKKLGAETAATVTAWSDRVLGSPGNPAVELSATDRKDALSFSRLMRDLLNGTIAALDPDDPADRESVKNYRLSGTTTKK